MRLRCPALTATHVAALAAVAACAYADFDLYNIFHIVSSMV